MKSYIFSEAPWSSLVDPQGTTDPLLKTLVTVMCDFILPKNHKIITHLVYHTSN